MAHHLIISQTVTELLVDCRAVSSVFINFYPFSKPAGYYYDHQEKVLANNVLFLTLCDCLPLLPRIKTVDFYHTFDQPTSIQ
ncbi:hypothetical protein MMC12_007681, partial [Toensbergia leucococca]|nr:hypothetical protein [Toensbergia leucococca]